MINVYFKKECGFSPKTLNAESADVSAVGQREILTVKGAFDTVIAQFDMNIVVGWANYDYEYDDDDTVEEDGE